MMTLMLPGKPCLRLLTLLLLCLIFPVQADNYSLTGLLDAISHDLLSAQAVDNSTQDAYQLAYDQDYPCTVTITGQAVINDADWIRQYRFELSDMEPGQLLRARDGRRAISYYAQRRTTAGTHKEYNPKKINAFTLNIASDNHRNVLQQHLDQVIRLCTERNTFQD